MEFLLFVFMQNNDLFKHAFYYVKGILKWGPNTRKCLKILCLLVYFGSFTLVRFLWTLEKPMKYYKSPEI